MLSLSSGIFFKLTFTKNSLRNNIRQSNYLSNSLDPDQDQSYVGPDLDLNNLQRLSVDDKNFPLVRKKLNND